MDWDDDREILIIDGKTPNQRGSLALRFIKANGLNPDGTIKEEFLTAYKTTDYYGYLRDKQALYQAAAERRRARQRRIRTLDDFVAEFPEAAAAVYNALTAGNNQLLAEFDGGDTVPHLGQGPWPPPAPPAAVAGAPAGDDDAEDDDEDEE